MSEQESTKEIAKNIFHEMQTMMTYLYSRWLDEQGLEDIAEYAKVIEPIVKKFGATFLKMQKRPFGFTYNLNGCVYQIKINSTTYSYIRKA